VHRQAKDVPIFDVASVKNRVTAVETMVVDWYHQQGWVSDNSANN